jgi:16S rRNA (cytosine967-C5)-methyltransferase
MSRQPAPATRGPKLRSFSAQSDAGRSPAGLAAREFAAWLVEAVSDHGRAFDDALATGANERFAGLETRDRAFARAIAATTLRRLGTIDAVLSEFLAKPLPRESGPAYAILRSAVAQLLLLDTPAHAAIGLSVEVAKRNGRSRRFAGLINAVLRRVSERTGDLPATTPVGAPIDVPDWLWQRWQSTYGTELAGRTAAASLVEAPLDISVKADPEHWAGQLGGRMLSTGSIRLPAHGRIEDLAGFGEGQWWVQDAAAALPSRLIPVTPDLEVADLCAAPGGKTASLAARGARVWAVDASPARLRRLEANMARLGLGERTTVVASDVLSWQPDRRFDAVLLDAPCLATGTIRRHPDILHLKRPGDIAKLADLQSRLLERAVDLVAAGGTLVYCVCSLEPEEGPQQIARLLASRTNVVRRPIEHGEAGIDAQWLTADGDLRTLPCHLPDPEPGLSGMDGFYAARLTVQ